MFKIYAQDSTGLLEEGFTPNKRQAERYKRALERQHPKAIVVIAEDNEAELEAIAEADEFL